MPNNVLITGVPGVGKTTLVKKICVALKERHPVGFYTAEIREEGVRKGFELVDLDSRRAILSHVEINSTCCVGKYGVDVAGFDAFLDSIPFFATETDLIVIDEIGKMECFSSRFGSVLERVLNSETLVIATIAIKGSGIIAEAKDRKDVKLFQITRKNRDSILQEIVTIT
jgi:nucleoside-triphosphatase